MKKTGYIVVLISASSQKEALRIKEALLFQRLAGCINLVKGIDSFFWWKGKVETSREVLLLVKTRESNFQKVAALVKKLHSYQTPEIIALPITAGYQPYLAWLEEATSIP